MRRLPIQPSQERSKIRFEKTLDAADEFLLDHDPETLTIEKITKVAGLQAQSVYRLFPSAAAINHGLALRHLLAMAVYRRDAETDADVNWQDKVRASLSVSRHYYEIHPQVAKLILSSGVSRDVRIADRANVKRLAEEALANFAIPSQAANWIPGSTEEDILRRLQITIDIVDAIWGQSFHYHAEITDFYFEESVRAMTRDLELYLPRLK